MKRVTKLRLKGLSGACAGVLAGAMMLPAPAFSEEVTLKSADGTVNLVGEFVEYSDDNYVIRTALGDLRISASRVRCEGAACPEIETTAADVKISGDDTIGLGMMPLLMVGFASSLNAESEIQNTSIEGQSIATLVGEGGFGDDIGTYLVSATSTEDGFSALLSGDANISMASRRIVPSEAKQLRASGAGNMVSPQQEHVIAVDSLVIITHPSNGVDEISMDQLRGVYSGQITNWSSLGGADAPIKVVSRAEESSTRTFFDSRVFENQATGSGTGHWIAGSDQEMAAIVNEDESAIGYVGFAFQRGTKPLTLVNECGIPTRPDEFAAKTEEYALFRRMYLYNRSDNLDEATQKFLDFAVTEDADGVVAKSGFIDLGIARRNQDLSGERALGLINADADNFESGVMREMLGAMVKSDRLSTTFRFRPGSSNVDEKARLDMARLIRFLAKAPENTSITLVGFTDDVGAFEANRRLSVNRAEQVRDDLRRAADGTMDNVSIEAIGFGEIAPSACNISDSGRGINRRVEVWITKDGA